MAMPILYCFDGLGGLAYSVTAGAAAACCAVGVAASCAGCEPRPHPAIANPTASRTRRLVIQSFINALLADLTRSALHYGPDKVRPSLPATPSAATLAGQVDPHGADNDRADDNVLNVRGHLHQVQAVPENTKNEHAHQRRTDSPDPTADSAAADHHGGN